MNDTGTIPELEARIRLAHAMAAIQLAENGTELVPLDPVCGRIQQTRDTCAWDLWLVGQGRWMTFEVVLRWWAGHDGWTRRLTLTMHAERDATHIRRHIVAEIGIQMARKPALWREAPVGPSTAPQTHVRNSVQGAP